MKKVAFLTILAVGIAVAVFSPRAKAAGPEFLVSWKARGYAPAGYAGRIIPATRSTVMASFEIIENGKLVDLSGETVYWYLDDQLIAKGKGSQTAGFQASEVPGAAHDLRIQINNFRNQSKILVKTVTVPVATPDVVIENKFLNNQFSGSNIHLVAQPYFFNAQNLSDLQFSWEVNGQKPSETTSPEILDINLPGVPNGSSLSIRLNIQNPADIFETASAATNLIFRK